MKLLSYRGANGDACVGALVDGRVVDLTAECQALAVPEDVLRRLRRHGLAPAPGGMLRLLQCGAAGIDGLAARLRERLQDSRAEHIDASSVELLAPVPRPGKIVAIGRNYADHAKETGVDPFEAPRIISKMPSSVAAPNSDIARPEGVTKLDFEIELAVVIGAFAHRATRAAALDAVAGYTILDDLSAREFQFDVPLAQTTFAKSMDGFCPMGPWLVTRDEIADPQALELHCSVNGQPMQHGHTADMLFPVDRLIEYISGFMTLEPGDVIATGTPAGIGAFRDPPVWLAPGDRIRMEISGIGVLEHEITGAPAPATDRTPKEQA